ncbi:ISL3 family transposase [Endozoicomonas numazuensis]|uniref:Transposase n=2 Tax=Endozoicomonas numazuensis TaxID=1137799 RepID=A0A081NI95_9GAMM|nr:ISL3 family transposase [Endozoicomonas numazuensis]KEQ15032.1 transposase [Endozoicomonas numazuensis]KEQ17933.1 transposase [Endozoicomonas numazuensis]KEQ18168.1 transposase [Endozoicomonas numazuensis]
MLIKTILNKVHKLKSFVYQDVKLGFYQGSEVFNVTVVPRKNSHAICSGCQKPAPGYDHLAERRFEFIPLWGIRVFLLYIMRRVECNSCGVKVEQVPWADGKKELTKVYMQFLAHWAKKLSWKEVASSFSTSWEKVFHAVEYVVEWGKAHRTLDNVRAIGVDEVAYQTGHKYLTVVYQIDRGCTRLLWVSQERTEATIRSFFAFFGTERSQRLEYVCSDMWKPYVKAIAECASQALHILDRFHIVAMLNKAIDEVRASEHKQLQADGYEPVLKKTRWCLLKRKENLTEKEEIKLNTVLQYNLKSVRAYLLREEFQAFWEYISPHWAEKYLDRWCTRVMRSKIEPMKKVAKTVRRHKPLILNWFRAKKAYSSGIVEGLNTKIKLTTRKSYGFRTYKCAEIALYHALGKLPEPEMTHRFY